MCTFILLFTDYFSFMILGTRIDRSKLSHNKQSPSLERQRATSARVHDDREYSPGRSASHRRDESRQHHDNADPRKRDREIRRYVFLVFALLLYSHIKIDLFSNN